MDKVDAFMVLPQSWKGQLHLSDAVRRTAMQVQPDDPLPGDPPAETEESSVRVSRWRWWLPLLLLSPPAIAALLVLLGVAIDRWTVRILGVPWGPAIVLITIGPVAIGAGN